MSAATRRAAAAVGTLTGLIMLIGAKTGGAALPPTQVALPAGAAAGAGRDGPAPVNTRVPNPTGPPAGTGSSPTPTSTGNPDRVVMGPVVDNRYGPVQVRVTLRAGRIVDVSAVQLPSDRNRSRAISNYAAPILGREALAAQGAQIDSISGASYTSDGYAQSLQAALDQARP
jgi:uncharacterized protein with FMN-binding domain